MKTTEEEIGLVDEAFGDWRRYGWTYRGRGLYIKDF